MKHHLPILPSPRCRVTALLAEALHLLRNPSPSERLCSLEDYTVDISKVIKLLEEGLDVVRK